MHALQIGLLSLRRAGTLSSRFAADLLNSSRETAHTEFEWTLCGRLPILGAATTGLLPTLLRMSAQKTKGEVEHRCATMFASFVLQAPSGAKSNSGNLPLSIGRILVQFLITRDHALERKVFFDVLPDHVCFDVEIHGPLCEL
jgi:hypothetical protein